LSASRVGNVLGPTHRRSHGETPCLFVGPLRGPADKRSLPALRDAGC